MCLINQHSHHWGGHHPVALTLWDPGTGVLRLSWIQRTRGERGRCSVNLGRVFEYFNILHYMKIHVYIYICIFFCKYMYIYINQPTKACFYVSRTSHALILRGATRMSIEWVKVPLVVTDNFLEVEMKRWLLRSYVVVGGRHWDFDLSNAKQHL